MSKNGNGNNGHRQPAWWSRWRGTKRPHHADSSTFRRLALQLHYDLAGADQPRAVLLASPLDADISAQGSLMLASCLADELRRPVLLIDASPEGCEATQLMKGAPGWGFADLLGDPSLTLSTYTAATTHENVYFLPAGSRALRAWESAPLAATLAQASAEYAFVIVAGGAVLNNSLARAVAPHVGCVLLLGVENETMVDDLDVAQNALLLGKARRVALVLTTKAEAVR